MTPEQIAEKYVHGKHENLTDADEKREMAADIRAYAESYMSEKPFVFSENGVDIINIPLSETFDHAEALPKSGVLKLIVMDQRTQVVCKIRISHLQEIYNAIKKQTV